MSRLTSVDRILTANPAGFVPRQGDRWVKNAAGTPPSSSHGIAGTRKCSKDGRSLPLQQRMPARAIFRPVPPSPSRTLKAPFSGYDGYGIRKRPRQDLFSGSGYETGKGSVQALLAGYRDDISKTPNALLSGYGYEIRKSSAKALFSGYGYEISGYGYEIRKPLFSGFGNEIRKSPNALSSGYGFQIRQNSTQDPFSFSFSAHEEIRNSPKALFSGYTHQISTTPVSGHESEIRKALFSGHGFEIRKRHPQNQRFLLQSRSSLDQEEERWGNWIDGPQGLEWDAEEIARAVGGQVVRASPKAGSISTDGRTIEGGQWFLALMGPRFDGHDFLQQARDRGCVGFIGRAALADWHDGGFVHVDDGHLALQRLAADVRRRYGGAVVGITGSTGKTTVRAMTALALGALGRVHETHGNFNNLVGVPKTLLILPSTARACVLELGMSHRGQIEALATIARPTVRVVLNVGPGHLENFGSLEEVAAAKGEILSGAEPGDVYVLNADDPLVMSLPIPPGLRVVLFGTQDGCHVKLTNAQVTKGGRAVKVVLEHFHTSSIWAENSSCGSQILETLRASVHHLHTDDDKSSKSISTNSAVGHKSDHLQKSDDVCNAKTKLASEIDCIRIPGSVSTSGVGLISRVEFEVPSPGLHLAINACAAAAVAVSMGVRLQVAGQWLTRYSPVGMRACWEEIGGGIYLVNDAYNSNPMSVASGLQLLDSIECQGRKIALLGDMLELGSARKRAHVDALALCRQLKFAVVGLVGPNFSEAASSLELDNKRQIVIVCKDSDELASKVTGILRPGDAVLVKGSRGMHMESVATAIRIKASG